MRLRTRVLFAVCLLALFVALPGPGADGGPFLGQLQVRSWLLDAHRSPLRAWTADGRVPALAVDLRQSPPDVLGHGAAAMARLAHEWAAARTAEGAPTAVATDGGTLLLAVRVGTAGLQAEVALPDGGAATLRRALPTRLSLVPAAVAIVAAVLLQRVLLALLLAGLCGSAVFVMTSLDGYTAAGLPLDVLAHFFGECLWGRALGEDFYLHITAFVVMLFAMVAIVQAGGGFLGLGALLQRRVRGPASAQFASFATGCLLLFDDYTNCLVTGTAMRPLTDAMRVSRAKLAWIVDSTAAPIAGVSLFSTWVAYEISQFRAPLALITRPDGTPYRSDDAMDLFVQALPLRSYCWFALALVALAVLLRRDFGPMLRCERLARATATPPWPPTQGDAPPRARLALLPLGALVATIASLLVLGWPNDLALLAGSAAGLCVALVGGRLFAALPLSTMLRASSQAMARLALPVVVLFLAWTLGHVTADLGTSHYLTAAVRSWLRPEVLPLALLLLAGVIAFATGTSFGTMAILLPNVVLLAHELGGGELLLLLCIAAVLEGAIFGDHCSPISDTTLLSSLSSGCDHVEHVVTQLPYALLALVASALCGFLPVALLGWHAVWPGLGAGVLLLAGWLLFVGRDPGRQLPP